LIINDLSASNIKKLNLVLLILVTSLILIATIFLPFFGFLWLALLPIPTALLLLSGRKRDSAICAVLGTAPLFFLNYMLAITVAASIVAVSFIYKIYIDRDKSTLFAVGNIFLAFLGIAILYILISSVLGGINVVSEFFKSYNGYIDNLQNDIVIKKYGSLIAMDEVQFNSAIKQSQKLLKFIPYLLPGIWIACCVCSSIINYFISSIVFKKQGINIKSSLAFKKWDIRWYYCWGIIIGLTLILIPNFNASLGMLVDVVGYNFLIVFGFLYSVVGVSVIWGIFDRFNVPIMWRIIIFIIFGMFVAFIFILPVIGLIDIWANFRKLDRG